MRRLTAAVLATAAAIAITGTPVSAVVPAAVRAEIVVAGEGHPLDVRRIRIVDGLRPGESYRLPTFSIRNHRGFRTAYRLVVSAGPARGERRPPRRWLRFVPAAVVIDAGRTHAVGVRLELPDDAVPGMYAVVLGARPGGSEGARLTFRIEPAESTPAWLRQTANLAIWVVAALAGAVLVVFLVRAGMQSRKQASAIGSAQSSRIGSRRAQVSETPTAGEQPPRARAIAARSSEAPVVRRRRRSPSASSGSKAANRAHAWPLRSKRHGPRYP
jgi:hypothetical protein